MQALAIFEMEIPQLGKKRNIRIWVPDGYSENTEATYPVVYMHDGQNLFDRSTSAYGEIWDVQTAVRQLVNEKVFEGAIVVGIDNAEGIERLDEYSPWPSNRYEELKKIASFDRNAGGDGEAYARFVVETLKPFVDNHYRTKPDRNHTALIGSSMGGYISLYMGARYPDVFSMIGAFSTAVWFNEASLLGHLKTYDPKWKTKWYLDVGTCEGDSSEESVLSKAYVEGTQAVESVLKTAGVSSDRLMKVIDRGAIHNETAWARRLPKALEWLFE